jgi:hypothetical protein
LFGLEFGMDFAGNNDSSVRVTNTFINTQNDKLGFEHNHNWNIGGTITAPISQNLSLVGKGGYSRLNGTAHIGCFDSCTAAGTAPFHSKQDIDVDGYYLGIGVQGGLGRLWERPLLWRLDYTHYEYDSKRVTAGNPAAAALAFEPEPSVDRIAFSLIMGLGGFPNMANGGPLSWSASDTRLKRDIVQVGSLDNGLALYRYKYINGDPRDYVGVMAQEVLEVMPDAVETASDGYYRVNYGKLGIRLQTWDQYQWTQTAATTQAVWRPVQGFQPVAAVQRECAAPKEDFAMIVAALPDVLPVAH